MGICWVVGVMADECPVICDGKQEYFGVTPDVTTMGKVIGGGLPVGAYGGRKDIMEVRTPYLISRRRSTQHPEMTRRFQFRSASGLWLGLTQPHCIHRWSPPLAPCTRPAP